MLTGIYPGTFDPLTIGHVDILNRASKIVDNLIVAIAENSRKSTLFSPKQRATMMRTCLQNQPDNIQVITFNSLLVELAEKCNAQIIFRGLRTLSDFEQEFQMASMNRKLRQSMETVFLMADTQHQAVSSRLVKEIARQNGNLSPFVPENVRKTLQTHFQKNTTP